MPAYDANAYTPVRIIANGDLTLSANPACQYVFWGDWTPTVTPDGTPGNEAGAVRVGLSGYPEFYNWTHLQNGVLIAYLSNNQPGTGPVELLASRRDFNSRCTNSWPDGTTTTEYQFNITGSTTLTIDVLSAAIAPSAATVAQGQAIAATATAINVAPGGLITWVFDTTAFAPPIALPACANLTSCTYAPPRSGLLRVSFDDGYGAGQGPSAASPVYVVRCPTGDSLLDNPVLRIALSQAVKDSWADSLSEQRREVGGYAFFDSLGLHTVRTEDSTKYNPCSLSYGVAANAVLIFHVHPFNPPEGFRNADILPSNCAELAGTRYDVKTFGGLSPEDWHASVNTGMNRAEFTGDWFS